MCVYIFTFQEYMKLLFLSKRIAMFFKDSFFVPYMLLILHSQDQQCRVRILTFVSTSHPLEIVCKSSLASNEVSEDSNLKGRRTRGEQYSACAIPRRPRACLTHMCFTSSMPHASPSAGTYLRHLKVQSARNVFWGLGAFDLCSHMA